MFDVVVLVHFLLHINFGMIGKRLIDHFVNWSTKMYKSKVWFDLVKP